MFLSNKALKSLFLAWASCSEVYEVHKNFEFEADATIEEGSIWEKVFRLPAAKPKNLLQGRRRLSSDSSHLPGSKAVLGF